MTESRMLIGFIALVLTGAASSACSCDGNGEADTDVQEDEITAETHDDGESPGEPAEEIETITDPPPEEAPGDPTVEDPATEEEVVEEDVAADVEPDEIEDAPSEEGLTCDPPKIYHPGFGICVSTEDLGADCSDSPTLCKEGQECVEYFGIAGHPFHDCYIRCGPTPARLCPEGYLCLDIADGPQNVCMAD